MATAKTFNAEQGLSVGTGATLVIDSSRNITAGTIGSGAITVTSAGITQSGGDNAFTATNSTTLIAAHNKSLALQNTVQYTKTATGTISQNTIVVSPDNTNLTVGMKVTGTGIGSNAQVTNIAGTTLTLSVVNAGAVSGTMTFTHPVSYLGSTGQYPLMVQGSPTGVYDLFKIAYDGSLVINGGTPTTEKLYVNGAAKIVNNLTVDGTLITSASLNITANSTFGTNSSNTMTVNATPTFAAAVQVNNTITSNNLITGTRFNATGNNTFSSNNQGTAASYGTFLNTGGTLYVGIDDSTGVTLSTGTAYGALLAYSGTELSLGVNNAPRIRIDSSGNFSPNVDNTQDLGRTSKRYKLVYAIGMDSGSSADLNLTSPNQSIVMLSGGGTLTWGSSGALYPSIPTKTLGLSGNRWGTAFLTNIEFPDTTGYQWTLNGSASTGQYWNTTSDQIEIHNVGATKITLGLNGEVTAGSFIGTAANSIRMKPDATANGYAAFWRNDGTNLYLLSTAQNDTNGSFNSFRPFMYTLSTGVVQIGTTGAGGSTTIYSGTTNTLTLDSGTTGAINIGTNANAKAITIGNSTGATGVQIQTGTGSTYVIANSAVTNTSFPALLVYNNTSGTPANGIGTEIVLATETSNNNTEWGVGLVAVATDTTPASEDFDLVIQTMAGGAARAERARITSGGVFIATAHQTSGATGQFSITTRDTGNTWAIYNTSGQLKFWETSDRGSWSTTGLTIAGTLTHNGLTMSAAASGNISIDQSYTFTMGSTALSTTWVDTGIDAANELTTGVYTLKLQAGTNEFYVGTMPWFSSNGAATLNDEYTEIPLMKYGDGGTASFVYIRILRSASAAPKLQISASTSLSAYAYVLSFRKLMA